MAQPTTPPAINPDVTNMAIVNQGTTFQAFVNALDTNQAVSTSVSAAYNPERDRLYQLISELDRVLTNAGVSV